MVFDNNIMDHKHPYLFNIAWNEQMYTKCLKHLIMDCTDLQDIAEATD